MKDELDVLFPADKESYMNFESIAVQAAPVALGALGVFGGWQLLKRVEIDRGRVIRWTVTTCGMLSLVYSLVSAFKPDLLGFGVLKGMDPTEALYLSKVGHHFSSSVK